MDEITGDELRLFQKSLRRHVVGVTVWRDLLDFDQPFVDGTLDVGVDQADGNSKFTRQAALRDITPLDRVKEAEEDRLFGSFIAI